MGLPLVTNFSVALSDATEIESLSFQVLHFRPILDDHLFC